MSLASFLELAAPTLTEQGQMDSPRSVPKANPSEKEHVLV